MQQNKTAFPPSTTTIRFRYIVSANWPNSFSIVITPWGSQSWPKLRVARRMPNDKKGVLPTKLERTLTISRLESFFHQVPQRFFFTRYFFLKSGNWVDPVFGPRAQRATGRWNRPLYGTDNPVRRSVHFFDPSIVLFLQRPRGERTLFPDREGQVSPHNLR